MNVERSVTSKKAARAGRTPQVSLSVAERIAGFAEHGGRLWTIVAVIAGADARECARSLVNIGARSSRMRDSW